MKLSVDDEIKEVDLIEKIQLAFDNKLTYYIHLNDEDVYLLPDRNSKRQYKIIPKTIVQNILKYPGDDILPDEKAVCSFIYKFGIEETITQLLTIQKAINGFDTESSTLKETYLPSDKQFICKDKYVILEDL